MSQPMHHGHKRMSRELTPELREALEARFGESGLKLVEAMMEEPLTPELERSLAEIEREALSTRKEAVRP